MVIKKTFEDHHHHGHEMFTYLTCTLCVSYRNNKICKLFHSELINKDTVQIKWEIPLHQTE